MKEFKKSVATLIETFTAGLAAIRGVRRRRKVKKASSPPASVATAETRLSKSLKRSLQDVRDVYLRDRKRFGPQFAAGDEPARNSLRRILEKLNSALARVKERLTKGRCTRDDYKALARLSNDSRAEAISTLYGLSARLSQSSISSSGRSQQINSSREHLLPTRSNSATKLDSGRQASSTDKTHRRRHSRKSQADSSSDIPSKTAETHESKRRPNKRERTDSATSLPTTNSKAKVGNEAIEQKLQRSHTPTHLESNRVPNKRVSVYSFKSDSTKIGEIPEKRWATREGVDPRSSRVNLATTAFPLSRWQDSKPEPVKKSMFMRMFGR